MKNCSFETGRGKRIRGAFGWVEPVSGVATKRESRTTKVAVNTSLCARMPRPCGIRFRNTAFPLCGSVRTEPLTLLSITAFLSPTANFLYLGHNRMCHCFFGGLSPLRGTSTELFWVARPQKSERGMDAALKPAGMHSRRLFCGLATQNDGPD